MTVSLCMIGRCLGTQTQWLFLQEEEHGVDELEVLGEVVELCRKLATLTAT